MHLVAIHRIILYFENNCAIVDKPEYLYRNLFSSAHQIRYFLVCQNTLICNPYSFKTLRTHNFVICTSCGYVDNGVDKNKEGIRGNGINQEKMDIVQHYQYHQLFHQRKNKNNMNACRDKREEKYCQDLRSDWSL